MASESDFATVNRRLGLLEEDAKGEKLVSRHVLHKVTDVEKELSELRAEIVMLRADLPNIIAATVGPLLREAMAKK